MGRVNLDDLNWEDRHYRPMRAYAQSKLANLLFTHELQRRLSVDGSRVRALAAHPGVAATSLDQNLHGLQAAFTHLGYRFVAQKRPEYGAFPTLFAATQDLPGDSYVGPGGRNGGRPRIEKRTARDSDTIMARQLWDLSERLTGVRYP
jgi:NAD(P)-dependent dehydrogenase (short-subunit alcohol dehydrogenase family)